MKYVSIQTCKDTNTTQKLVYFEKVYFVCVTP